MTTTTQTTARLNAGTLRDLLARKGLCHRDHVRDYVRGWRVTVNGIPTAEPERILEFGDVVTVGLEQFEVGR
jgi:16S rRNA U516 pseudouridylate synthase RsuA-like enzyme